MPRMPITDVTSGSATQQLRPRLNVPVTFKHLKSEHASLMRSGAIRISAFSRFREIEAAPSGVKDEVEGQSFAALSGHYPGQGPSFGIFGETASDFFHFVGTRIKPGQRLSERDIRRLVTEAFGINVMNANLTIGSNVSILDEVPPLYLLSVSLIPEVGLFDGYDEVVRIGNLGRLAAAIVRAAHGELRSWQWGYVRYEPQNSHVSEAFRPADPFVKKPDLVWQKEVRVVFQPHGQLREYLDVQSSEIAKVVAEGTR